MKEEKIILSKKAVNRYTVIKDLIDRKLKSKEAAMLLCLSTRQIRRLKNMVMANGIKGVVHGNTGRPPAVAVCKTVKETILNLYSTVYKDFNCAHFTEMLKDHHNVSVSAEFVRCLLLATRLRVVSRRPPKHRVRRDRMPSEGLLIQMDTSDHNWFKGSPERTSLIAAIDDATNEVSSALFAHKDSTENNMLVMKRLILKKGIPAAFYVDGASHFKTSRHSSYRVNLKGDYGPTQIGRALGELGIKLIPASSPQAKGRVERLFKTLQDRLINELALNGISTVEEANLFLHKTFLPKHNAAFKKPPKERAAAYRPTGTEINLDAVFSIKEERTVMADNTVSFKNRILQILPDGHRPSYTKAKVTIELRLNSKIHIKYKDHYLNVKELKAEPKQPKPKNALTQKRTFSLCEEADIISLR